MEKRIDSLKKAIINKRPWVCPERARYFTQSWKMTEGEPIPIRRALAFREVLLNQTVHITPGELIIGNQASGLMGTPVFPEYGVEWMEKEFDNLSTRALDPFDISEEVLSELKELFGFWKGRTHYDRVKAESMRVMPEKLLPAWDPENGYFDGGVVSNSGRMATGNGHVIINFDRVIRSGLRAIIDDAKQYITKCDENISDPECIQRKIFLRSAIISLEAAIKFAHRYAEAAVKMAVKANGERRRELKEIASRCKKVPEFPADSFWDALQSYWMLHLLLQIETNGHSMSLGRFDQYLYPYFRHSIDKGIMTPEKAQELVECFLIKFNEIRKIRQWSHTRKMHGYPLFQTLTIGGITPSGEDAVNDLSYLVLKATANVKLQEPTTVARIHPKNNQDFITACCKTIVEHGGGLPGMFNDEVGITMLMKTGVSLEDARNWAVDGCCEPIVPGKHNTITSGTCHINLLKVLEIALNNGNNKTTGRTLCPGNGGLAHMKSYIEVVDAYKKQLDFYVSVTPLLDAITSRVHRDLTPCPFLSALLDYRIEIGKDVEEGGGPNYNSTLMIGHASINVGNSLYAIKKNVFEDKLFSTAELAQALEENFSGPRGEKIRTQLLDCPKYGNDIDEVDYVVRDSLNLYLKSYDNYKPLRGGFYCPSPQTLSANAYTGSSIGGTPDGRKDGEPTADNISPAAGDDVKGATATLCSVAKLDHVNATHGTILNMKLHPSSVQSPSKMAKFAALIRAFFDIQGFQVQFNIISAETLRDAQKRPEHYQNLIVKVAGYSARFTTLDEHLQNQIIARTEHGVS